MDVQIRHTPSFAVARCTLTGGETMRAESGAMMATSDGVAIEASMQGGLVKSLKRSVLGGESLFITTYTAPSGGGWVDCAARLPGDAMLATLDGSRALNIQRGSYLCSESTIEINAVGGVVMWTCVDMKGIAPVEKGLVKSRATSRPASSTMAKLARLPSPIGLGEDPIRFTTPSPAKGCAYIHGPASHRTPSISSSGSSAS